MQERRDSEGPQKRKMRHFLYTVLIKLFRVRTRTKISELCLHRTKFSAPAYARLPWSGKGWRLPAATLPVCGLDILEVLSRGRIVNEDATIENDERIASK